MAKYRFAWRGVDRKGDIQNGVLHAYTPEEVSHELKRQRIRATRIQRQFDLPSWLQLHSQPHVSARDITQFTRQLASCCARVCPCCKPLIFWIVARASPL
jgi:type II secretory pathway component PulF